MPYNGSGIYTIPVTMVPNTPATASDVNTNFSDIATALSTALPRDGQAAMTGVLLVTPGSESAPGIAFSGDTNTGIRRSAADTLTFVTGGVDRLSIGPTGSISGLVPASTDNAVVRFDGTTGGLQNSLVIVDDNGNLKAGIGTVVSATSANQLVAVGSSVAGVLIETSTTGQGILSFGDGALAGRVVYDHTTNAMTFNTNATLSATLSSAGALTLVGGLTATTGTFSGAVSGTTGTFSGALSGTTGTFSGAISGTNGTFTGTVSGVAGSFSGAVSGTTGTFSGAVSTSDRFIGSSSTILGTSGAGGTVFLRPNGASNVTSQTTINSSGHLSSERLISESGVFSTSPAGTLFFRPNGQSVTTNQMSYTTAGNLTAAGDITANSDIKLKKHVKTITGAVDLVKQLRGVRFTRRKVNTKSIGFIAQEVEAVFPELVHENENGKSVSYPNFVALLVEATKELSVKVDRLESRK